MEAINKNQVKVDTSKYRNSQGHEPKGYGNWAFGATRNPNIEDVKWFYGSYAEAKKQAISEAAANGNSYLYVQP